ncbi:hypothetical protein ElyMa_003187900 [Elysia marginata]|uniref:Uncharacterized protein n=1 Tax=Elysia marginata TaxID=1093978 RepID=A0AAV4IZK3_9GAST|nr:hypothetical protein ElyMa_003187900 [Elysia marginata]
MSRFSTESLQQVLDSILPPKTPGTPTSRSNGRPQRKVEVRSIKELRDVVKMIMTKRESGSIKASDADALKYMEHFFFAVYCMSEAKRLIDDVFADLYYSYYKPETESRLLPDTFAKFYKCLELSKQWWVLAHDVYPDLPFQRHPPEQPADPSDYGQSLSEDSRDWDQENADRSSQVVMQTKEAIREINNEIEAVHEELEALSKREEKFTILVETYDKVGQDIETRSRERQQLYALRDRLAQSGQKDASNREELQQAEAEIRQLDGMIKLLEFQHSLLLQDYLIHMEIRPSIIRFQGEAALKLKDAQMQLEQQALNLDKLEQELSAAAAAPTVDDTTSKVNNNREGTKTSSETSTRLLSDVQDSRKENNAGVEEQNQHTASTNVRKLSQDINKNNVLKISNSKRQVAFVNDESNQGIANSFDKKANVKSSKSNEKSPAVIKETEPLTKKLIDKRKADNVAQTRTKRNSLPGMVGPQKSTPQVERRKSHDVSNAAVDKSDLKELRQVRKDTITKTPQTIRQQSKDDRNDVAAGHKRQNPLVKSKSSKDVIHKTQNVAVDTKSQRNRSSSDPPVFSSDSVPKTTKKLSPPKAWDKTPASSDAASAHRLRAPRPKPSPAIQSNNNYVK